MKAITTKYMPNTGRIKAQDDDRNVAYIQTRTRAIEDNHRAAAIALCQKMGWKGILHGGHLKDGMVWVFQGEGGLLDERLTIVLDEDAPDSSTTIAPGEDEN